MTCTSCMLREIPLVGCSHLDRTTFLWQFTSAGCFFIVNALFCSFLLPIKFSLKILTNEHMNYWTLICWIRYMPVETLFRVLEVWSTHLEGMNEVLSLLILQWKQSCNEKLYSVSYSLQVILVKFLHLLNVGFQFLITSFHLLGCLYAGSILWKWDMLFGSQSPLFVYFQMICCDKLK